MMNILIAQCGGPTPVLNAALAAAVAAGQATPEIDRVWGARLGLEGVVCGDWADLTGLTPAQLARLSHQPGAALGSGRYRPQLHELSAAAALLDERVVGGVILCGGNGAMTAAHELALAARSAAHPLHVIGLPKTIDNDLAGIDAAPGYGSAANFISAGVADAWLDLYAMRHFDDVAVVEVMGRHAGWLAAASALARQEPDEGPHIILVPERSVDEDALLAEIARLHGKHEVCLIAAAEGVQDRHGRYLAEKQAAPLDRDASDQALLGLGAGVAGYLAARINRALGLRCRRIRPDVMQRSARRLVTAADHALSRRLGEAAVQALTAGRSDVMVTPEPIPLASIAGQTRTLPAFYYAGSDFDITPAGVADLRRRIGAQRETAGALLF
ncbi:MAG: diphosphate--fructose-6-phosphate 1-phosphotransferase [Caldilineaceae bacterium]|nr:diphosphate--fructose-6-phosphate 1-phosphotransferase [Caldilineaceae bacterium]